MKDNNLSVLLPIDNLEGCWPPALKGAKIGALLHPASISASLRHSLERLKQQNGKLFHLSALFGPQHGYLGQTQDNMIEWKSYRHPELDIPVYSLYGEHRKPTPEMLGEGAGLSAKSNAKSGAKLDALLVDLQDVGARYYTFIWSLYLCMEACETAGIPVVVADRPNPLGNTVEGPLLDPEYKSFVGLHPIPVRHGKTIGELARQFQREAFPKCDLHVLPMEGWQPEAWYDETGLPWVFPSPNMPTLDTAIVYPGMCLLEGTQLSEGRGTTRPFELFGAPYIQAEDFCRKMNKRGLPGVYFREAYFQPTFHKFGGELCGGAQIHVLDREAFLPYFTGLEILHQVLEDYGDHFEWKQPPYEYVYDKLPIEVLLGGPLKKFFPEAV